MADGNPVRFSGAYPDPDLNRVTTFFGLFTAIPILIVLVTDRYPSFRLRP
jgi:hypothetical protein